MTNVQLLSPSYRCGNSAEFYNEIMKQIIEGLKNQTKYYNFCPNSIKIYTMVLSRGMSSSNF